MSTTEQHYYESIIKKIETQADLSEIKAKKYLTGTQFLFSMLLFAGFMIFVNWVAINKITKGLEAQVWLNTQNNSQALSSRSKALAKIIILLEKKQSNQ